MSPSRSALVKPIPKSKPSGRASARRCAQEIMDTVPMVMRYIRGELRRTGGPLPSVPQMRTLVFLSFYPRSTLAGVAAHLGVTPPTASAIVNRLVGRGWVNRTEHPRERRCVVLTLTRSGSRKLRQVRQAACKMVMKVLANRPATELNRIMGGVSSLGEVFKRVIEAGDGRHRVNGRIGGRKR
jgi:DNA-binding MarR family transcriptional regulator